MDLNLKLITLRREKGLTQSGLAEKIGIPKHNIGAYENGRATPPLAVLKKFIDFYEIPKKDIYNFLFN